MSTRFSFACVLAALVLALLGGCTSVHVQRDLETHEIRVSPQPEAGVTYTLVPIGGVAIQLQAGVGVTTFGVPEGLCLYARTLRDCEREILRWQNANGRGVRQAPFTGYPYGYQINPLSSHNGCLGWTAIHHQGDPCLLEGNRRIRGHQNPPPAPQQAASAAPPKGRCVRGQPCPR